MVYSCSCTPCNWNDHTRERKKADHQRCTPPDKYYKPLHPGYSELYNDFNGPVSWVFHLITSAPPWIVCHRILSPVLILPIRFSFITALCHCVQALILDCKIWKCCCALYCCAKIYVSFIELQNMCLPSIVLWHGLYISANNVWQQHHICCQFCCTKCGV